MTIPAEIMTTSRSTRDRPSQYSIVMARINPAHLDDNTGLVGVLCTSEGRDSRLLGWRKRSQYRNSDRESFWPGFWSSPSFPVGVDYRESRSGIELLFPHAVSYARSHHHHERGQQAKLRITTGTSTGRSCRHFRPTSVLSRSISTVRSVPGVVQRRLLWQRLFRRPQRPTLVQQARHRQKCVILDAYGDGQFVGVMMSVLNNQWGAWNEGDDMIFIDGAKTPRINGTGGEDYFNGAWGFGPLYSTPLVGIIEFTGEQPGSRFTMYRWHPDAPVRFHKSIKVIIEDAQANLRSGNIYSVAYWYQKEPHSPFPPLPPVEKRIPKIAFTGGPGPGSGHEVKPMGTDSLCIATSARVAVLSGSGRSRWFRRACRKQPYDLIR
jgi:Protein of unknown function (DUF2961)